MAGIVLAACSGEGTPQPAPTSTPRLSATTSRPTASPTATLTPTATSTPTATPVPVPEPSAYDLLYRKFGETGDTVWRVAPASPSDSQQLAVIDHAPGFGIEPSLSPDGSAIAYTVMPNGASDPAFEAQAFLLNFGDEPELIHVKANHSARQDPMPLIWRDGVLLPDIETGIVARIRRRNLDTLIFEKVAEGWNRGRPYSIHAQTKDRYLPTHIARTTEFKAKEVDAAIIGWMDSGHIVTDQVTTKTPAGLRVETRPDFAGGLE